MGETVQVLDARTDRQRCPLCFERLAAEQARACAACATAYHATCFDELGGCGTSGCAGAASARVARVQARARIADAVRRDDLASYVCAFAATGVTVAAYVGALSALGPEQARVAVVPALLLVVPVMLVPFLGVQRLARAPRAGVTRGLVALVCGAVMATLMFGASAALLAAAGERFEVTGLEPVGPALVVVAALLAFLAAARAAWRSGG